MFPAINVTDACRRPLSTGSFSVAIITLFRLFTSNIPRALVVLFSLPDVKGALPPTVTATLVHAIPAFRISKITSLTHKKFSNTKHAPLDLYLSILRQRAVLFYFTNIP
jgi:hypothetical protein